jgi:hypothetical protein
MIGKILHSKTINREIVASHCFTGRSKSYHVEYKCLQRKKGTGFYYLFSGFKFVHNIFVYNNIGK